MSIIGRSIPVARSLTRSVVTSASRSSDALFVHREKDTDAEKFEWTAENRKRAEAIIGIYPKGFECGAIMPLLDLAQRQYGKQSLLLMTQKIDSVTFSQAGYLSKQ